MERECVDLPFWRWMSLPMTYRFFKKPFLGATFGEVLFNMFGVTAILLYSQNNLKRRFPKLNATLGKSHFWIQLWGNLHLAYLGRKQRSFCYGGQNMRKKNYKGRCEKRAIKKCESICKTYDPIQSAFVTILDNRDDIAEIQCNVELDGDAADFTTDIRM